MRYLHFLITLLLSTCILISGCGGLGKSEADYKKEAVLIKYEDVARNPDSFAKKAVFVTGMVREAKEQNKNVELLLQDPNSLNHYFWISYTAKENEERFIKGDTIRVWGDFQKTSTRPVLGGLDQINTLLES